MSKSKPPRPPVDPTAGEWTLRESHGQIEVVATEGDANHLVATLTCSHVARPQGKCNLRGKDEVIANARRLVVARESYELCQLALALHGSYDCLHANTEHLDAQLRSLIASVETPVDIPAGRSLAPCVELGIGKE